MHLIIHRYLLQVVDTHTSLQEEHICPMPQLGQGPSLIL